MTTTQNSDATGQAPRLHPGGKVNAMSVDIEDYYQVFAFHDVISRDDWDNFPRRVEDNTSRVLDLFAETGTKATFFTLGMQAERYPKLMQRITAEGHELASHGWAHFHVFEMEPKTFLEDITRTKAVLEDTGGQEVRGYRAASFSVNPKTWWAYDALCEAGYEYSSSVNPIRHDHYGVPNAPRFPFKPKGFPIAEIPVSTTELFGRRITAGGGGFFRFFPYFWFHWNIARLNKQEGQGSIFYFHPWEIDPDQPRIQNCSAKSRFRHYVNLDRMAAKLKRLMGDFRWDRVDRVFPTDYAGLQEYDPEAPLPNGK